MALKGQILVRNQILALILCYQGSVQFLYYDVVTASPQSSRSPWTSWGICDYMKLLIKDVFRSLMRCFHCRIQLFQYFPPRRLHHPSILLLMGVCRTENLEGLALVYERVTNGSLYASLYQKVGLYLISWSLIHYILYLIDYSDHLPLPPPFPSLLSLLTFCNIFKFLKVHLSLCRVSFHIHICVESGSLRFVCLVDLHWKVELIVLSWEKMTFINSLAKRLLLFFLFFLYLSPKKLSQKCIKISGKT